MKIRLLTIIAVVFALGWSNAQVDFSIFLDKKQMKKSYNKLFHNFRDFGKVECLKGDCKNGFSVLQIVNGSQLKMIMVGSFKDRAISGNALVMSYDYPLYFESKVKNVVSEANSSNLKDIFLKYKDEFFESYFGNFSNNMLTKGEYFLNAKFKQIVKNPKSRYENAYRLKTIPLTHFNFLDQTKQDRKITYKYIGNFKKDDNGKPTFSFNEPGEYMLIKTVEFPKIILKGHLKDDVIYVANHYNSYNMLQEQLLVTSELAANANKIRIEKAKQLKIQREQEARRESEAEIAKIKASSPCNTIGKWVSPGDLPNYTGGSVCKKDGTLAAFNWQHPLMKNVSYTISHYNDNYNGLNSRSVYFPDYYVDQPGTYKIYANDNQIAYKDGKVFVTIEFNTNQYELCNSCHGTGQLYVADNNPNTLRQTYGWFLAYNKSSSWKRESTSSLIKAESRQTYINNFKRTGKLGLQWQNGLKEGFNIMPCVICDGMGCLVK